jgi:23S rRNA (guanine745-N1)-methyltransferase
VNLAPNHSGGGDSKEAVRARSSFLRSGYYTPAAEAIAALARELTPEDGLVLDAGCGEGYYSNRVAEEGFSVLGVDLSKFAVDTAAKSARRERMNRGQASSTLYAVGSVFELPVADGSFDTVINIFAPCAPAEYARVLKSGGHLIVAGAGERHLFGLKELIYDDPYLNEPRRDLPAEGGRTPPAGGEERDLHRHRRRSRPQGGSVLHDPLLLAHLPRGTWPSGRRRDPYDRGLL